MLLFQANTGLNFFYYCLCGTPLELANQAKSSKFAFNKHAALGAAPDLVNTSTLSLIVTMFSVDEFSVWTADFPVAGVRLRAAGSEAPDNTGRIQ